MEAFLDKPYNYRPRAIYGNKGHFQTVKSNLGLTRNKPKKWFQAFPRAQEMVGCVPNFANWLVERRITVIDDACMCKIAPSQLSNTTRDFDPVQFFLEHWNCCALHEFRSSYKSNSETNTFKGGAHLTEIVPLLICVHIRSNLEKHVKMIFQDVNHLRNKTTMMCLWWMCTEKQYDWALGSYIGCLIDGLLDWDKFRGGAPFHPVTYGLELNDFDDRQICHLPIKEHGNPIVKNENEAAYLLEAHPTSSAELPGYLHINQTALTSGFWTQTLALGVGVVIPIRGWILSCVTQNRTCKSTTVI